MGSPHPTWLNTILRRTWSPVTPHHFPLQGTTTEQALSTPHAEGVLAHGKGLAQGKEEKHRCSFTESHPETVS